MDAPPIRFDAVRSWLFETALPRPGSTGATAGLSSSSIFPDVTAACPSSGPEPRRGRSIAFHTQR
jgi:hypothetical protein